NASSPCPSGQQRCSASQRDFARHAGPDKALTAFIPSPERSSPLAVVPEWALLPFWAGWVDCLAGARYDGRRPSALAPILEGASCPNHQLTSLSHCASSSPWCFEVTPARPHQRRQKTSPCAKADRLRNGASCSRTRTPAFGEMLPSS